MSQKFFTLDQGAAALGISSVQLRQAAQALRVRLSVQNGTTAVEQQDLIRIRNYLTTLQNQGGPGKVTSVTLDTGYGRPPAGSYAEDTEELIGGDQPGGSGSGLFSQSEIDNEVHAAPPAMPVVEALPAADPEPDTSSDTDSGPVPVFGRMAMPGPPAPMAAPPDSAMFTGEGEIAAPGSADSAMFSDEGEIPQPEPAASPFAPRPPSRPVRPEDFTTFSEEGETVQALPRVGARAGGPPSAAASFPPPMPVSPSRAPPPIPVPNPQMKPAAGPAPSAPRAPAAPPARPAPAPPQAAAEPEPAASPNGKKVLLVEADGRSARVKKNALEREGFAVDWVPGAREMVASAGRGGFDLVLINHSSGADDGPRLLDALIAVHPAQPAAVMVPAADRATMQAVMNRGHGGCIAKDERFLQSLPAQVFGVLERLAAVAAPQVEMDSRDEAVDPEPEDELIELDEEPAAGEAAESGTLEETDEMPEIVPEGSAEPSPLDGFFDCSSAGMFRVGAAGRIVAANQALADLLLYPGVESFTDASLRDAVVADPRAFDSLMAGISRAAPGEGRLIGFRQADGEVVELAVYLKALCDEQGAAVGYDGVVVRPVDAGVPAATTTDSGSTPLEAIEAEQASVNALASRIDSLQAALQQSASELAELKAAGPSSKTTAAAPAQPSLQPTARRPGVPFQPAKRSSESAEVTIAAPGVKAIRPDATPTVSPSAPTQMAPRVPSPPVRGSAPPPPAVGAGLESPFHAFQMSGSGIFAVPQGSSDGLIEGEPVNGDKTNYEVLDLNTLARQAIWFVEPKIKSTGLPVDVVHRLGNCASVSGNRTQLREVIAKLLMNAVQLMPGGGKIFVSSGTVSKGAFVAVTNTGPGISADVRHRIFDDDFVPNTEWQRGLRECLDIMLRHDGKIGIISEPGRGATVTIRLPPVDDSVAATILR